MQTYQKLLNRILDKLPEPVRHAKDFYTRIGANFFSICQLFEKLYGNYPHYEEYLEDLVVFLREFYNQRHETLLDKDRQHAEDTCWFLHQNWVGLEINFDNYAQNWHDLHTKIAYWQELGITLLYVKNIPTAVFSAERKEIEDFSHKLSEKNIVFALDLSLNFLPAENFWVKKAFDGSRKFEKFFHVFEDHILPELYNKELKNTPHQNFIFSQTSQKWFMASHPKAHFDLNYAHPEVFIEMLKNLLFMANQGVNVVFLQHLDSLWKRMGTNCENQPENHWLLQLFKLCSKIVAPSLLLAADGLFVKDSMHYFGQATATGKELDLAQNTLLPTLFCDALATQESLIFKKSLHEYLQKPFGTTWINSIRKNNALHFPIEDHIILEVGFEPVAHRHFLVQYFNQEHSYTRAASKVVAGKIFGTTADLVGLRIALAQNKEAKTRKTIQKIILLHAVLLSFGGLPLLQYGDELGFFSPNPEDELFMDWKKAEKRHKNNSHEQQLFSKIQHLIAVRKASSELANFTNCNFEYCENKHILSFLRWNNQNGKILVLANFSSQKQYAQAHIIERMKFDRQQGVFDKISQTELPIENELISFEPFQVFWISQNS